MSIALREEVHALKRRVDEMEKLIAMLRESVAYLQGENVGKQLAVRETLTLPEKRKLV